MRLSAAVPFGNDRRLTFAFQFCMAHFKVFSNSHQSDDDN